MPVWRHSLPPVASTDRPLRLSLLGLPETIIERIRNVAMGGTGLNRVYGQGTSHFPRTGRQRRTETMRVLPRLRNKALSRIQRCRSCWRPERQGGFAGRYLPPETNEPFMDEARASLVASAHQCRNPLPTRTREWSQSHRAVEATSPDKEKVVADEFGESRLASDLPVASHFQFFECAALQRVFHYFSGSSRRNDSRVRTRIRQTG